MLSLGCTGLNCSQWGTPSQQKMSTGWKTTKTILAWVRWQTISFTTSYLIVILVKLGYSKPKIFSLWPTSSNSQVTRCTAVHIVALLKLCATCWTHTSKRVSWLLFWFRLRRKYFRAMETCLFLWSLSKESVRRKWCVTSVSSKLTTRCWMMTICGTWSRWRSVRTLSSDTWLWQSLLKMGITFLFSSRSFQIELLKALQVKRVFALNRVMNYTDVY